MSYQLRRPLSWMLVSCAFALSILTPGMSGAHKKQGHVVTGAMVGPGGVSAVFLVDTALQTGSAIVDLRRESTPRIVTIKCTYVEYPTGIFPRHTLYARGRSSAGNVYLKVQEVPGVDKVSVVGLSKRTGSSPCGGGDFDNYALAVVRFIKR